MKDFVTDDAEAVKDAIERNHNHLLLPQALERSIGLASAIYGLATHDVQIDFDKIEDRIAKNYQAANQVTRAPPRATAAPTATATTPGVQSFKRSFQLHTGKTLHDPRVGVMVIPMQVGGAAHLYIVFRGSRGDKGKQLNPESAGWDATEKENVDWNANLYNPQVTLPWGASKKNEAKVHAGFLGIYNSVSQQIEAEVRARLTPTTTVIVTGHSLGAALSVLCAHHLNAAVPQCTPFCFPFNTPRVGNAQFAEDFWLTIAQYSQPLPPERGSFVRCINMTRENDPVSKGGRKAFKKPMGEYARAALSVGGRNKLEGVFAVVHKAATIDRQKLNRAARYYQVPRQYQRHGKDFAAAHDYTKMQESILGEALFKK